MIPALSASWPSHSIARAIFCRFNSETVITCAERSPRTLSVMLMTAKVIRRASPTLPSSPFFGNPIDWSSWALCWFLLGRPLLLRLGYPVLPALPPARRERSRSSFPSAERNSIDVLPLYIAEFTQSFSELVLERLRVRGSYVECAYSRHLRLLPARRERPRRR